MKSFNSNKSETVYVQTKLTQNKAATFISLKGTKIVFYSHVNIILQCKYLLPILVCFSYAKNAYRGTDQLLFQWLIVFDNVT